MRGDVYKTNYKEKQEYIHLPVLLSWIIASKQAWKLYDDGMHLKLVDEILLGSNGYTDKAAKKIIEIALTCTQMPASSRPTMSEVVMLLSDRPTDLMQPAKRAFMDNDNRVPDDTSSTTGSSTSNAAAPFTEYTSRWGLSWN